MVIAQAISEYSASSGLASAVESLAYQFDYAVGAHGSSVLSAIGAGALLWWLWLRVK
jgi:hypothetical protein